MYNEFKTTEGKVLLSTMDYSWGDRILSALDIKDYMFSLVKEEATYYSDLYYKELNKLIEIHDTIDMDMEILKLKASIKKQLIDKGYELGKDVEVIIHK